MHSTKRDQMKRYLISTLLLGGLVMASAANADDRPTRRHEGNNRHSEDVRHSHRAPARTNLHDARRIDRRLDRQGRVIDHHLDALAFVAAVSGEYALAEALDRTGDRIERRYDQRGDRIVYKARKQAQKRTHHNAHAHTRKHHERPSSHRHHAQCGHGQASRSKRPDQGGNRHFVQRNTRFR